ncbi:LOW QUALITY PROTEIN: hypothetical protein TorRG33x02_307180, partial [Trema orientale]
HDNNIFAFEPTDTKKGVEIKKRKENPPKSIKILRKTIIEESKLKAVHLIVVSSFTWFIIIIFNIPTQVLIFFRSTKPLSQLCPVRTSTMSHFLIINTAKILNLIPAEVFLFRH